MIRGYACLANGEREPGRHYTYVRQKFPHRHPISPFIDPKSVMVRYPVYGATRDGPERYDLSNNKTEATACTGWLPLYQTTVTRCTRVRQ